MQRNNKGMFIKGHRHSPETIAKISAAKKGCKGATWMKGLTKETDERIARMAASKTGKKTAPRPDKRGISFYPANEFKKGQAPQGGIKTRFKAGPDHPKWNGGITSEHEKIRRGKQYKQWRDAVYRRDYFHCQICDKHCKAGDIVAHHINSFAAYPNLRFVVDNGTTLCRSCHIWLHRNEENKLCAVVI